MFLTLFNSTVAQFDGGLGFLADLAEDEYNLTVTDTTAGHRTTFIGLEGDNADIAGFIRYIREHVSSDTELI